MGGRAAGLAYASSTLHDEWSLLNNVGGLSKVNQPAAAFAYEVRSGLIGANRMAAVMAAPVKVGAAAFGQATSARDPRITQLALRLLF